MSNYFEMEKMYAQKIHKSEDDIFYLHDYYPTRRWDRLPDEVTYYSRLLIDYKKR